MCCSQSVAHFFEVTQSYSVVLERYGHVHSMPLLHPQGSCKAHLGRQILDLWTLSPVAAHLKGFSLYCSWPSCASFIFRCCLALLQARNHCRVIYVILVQAGVTASTKMLLAQPAKNTLSRTGAPEAAASNQGKLTCTLHTQEVY